MSIVIHFVRRLLLAILILAALTVISAYLLVGTAPGSRFLIKKVFYKYIPAQQVAVGQTLGSILNGVVLKDVLIVSPVNLPAGTHIHFEQIHVTLTTPDWRDLRLVVKEGKLVFPETEPIVVNGTLRNRVLDAKIQASGIALDHLLPMFTDSERVKAITGRIENAELNLTDSIENPYFSGQLRMTNVFINRYIQMKEVILDDISGSIREGVRFENATVKNIGRFPEGNVLKIQQLKVAAENLDLASLMVRVRNARLMLPYSEPLGFYGNYLNGALNMNFYSRALDIQEIVPLFIEDYLSKNLTGSAQDIDLAVTGKPLEPNIKGKIDMKILTYKGFVLMDAPAEVDLTFKGFGDNLEMYGPIRFHQGRVTSRDTQIDFNPSKLLFDGRPKNPGLDLIGTSKIDRYRVTVSVHGTMDEPELLLTSDPPRSHEMLLLMLATGQSWAGSADALEAGEFSPVIAKDFINYFLFAGRGSKFADKLGVTDFSIKYDEQTRGFGVKKKLSEQLKVGYEMEQVTPQQGTQQGITTTTQKIGGYLDFTDEWSMDISRELIPSDRANQQLTPNQEEPQGEIEALLKYKTSF